MVIRGGLEKIVVRISSKNTWAAKVKRNVAATILPVKEEREGECLNCGACCKLPVECPFLGFKGEQSYCTVYEFRPPSCRKYPRSEEEHLTKETCGYHFIKKEEYANLTLDNT